jgi:hypothetical protein
MMNDMKKIFVCALILSVFFGHAQSETEIIVTGKARLEAQPTVAQIHYSIVSQNESYTGAIEDLTNRVDMLARELQGARFKSQEIKTSIFRINKTYIWEDNRSNRKEGYQATQNLSVAFPFTKERLLEVLNKTTNSSADAEIRLSFDVDESKKEEIKSELLKASIQDARKNAEVLAGAAGVSLGEVKLIRHGSSPAIPRPMYNAASDARLMSAESTISNLTIDDLVFTDQVEVIFILLKK